MTQRVTPAIDSVGDISVHEKADVEYRPAFARNWYAHRSVGLWSITNIAAAISSAAVCWGYAAPEIVIGWLIFTVANAALYAPLSREFTRGSEQNAAAQIGLALIYGAIWGAVFLIAVPAMPAPRIALLAGLALFVATAAIGVFGPRRGAYVSFSIPLVAASTPALNANAAIDHAGLLTVCAFVFFVSAASIYGQFSRTVLKALDDFAAVSGMRTSDRGDNAALVFELQARALNRMNRERERLRTTLSAISDGVVTATPGNLVDYMNPVAEVLTGIELKDANGQPLEAIVHLASHSTGEAPGANTVRQRVDSLARTERERAVLVRADGTEYEIECRITRLVGDDGNHAGTICLLRDTSPRRLLHEKVNWYATHDILTGLLDRPEFERRIDHAIKRGTNGEGDNDAFCYLDIDQFRYLSDAHGIGGANRALAEVAATLQRSVGEHDVLARIGDDRFGILLDRCSPEKARLVAESLRTTIKRLSVKYSLTYMKLSASIGVTAIERETDTLSRVFNRARSACLRAKSAGGNKVVAIGAREQSERFRLACDHRLQEIRNALQTRDLELYYQRIRPIRPGYPDDVCELLVRLSDPVAEFLLPREFLVTDSHLELLPLVDKWVIESTATALRTGNPILSEMDTIFVTVSGKSINDDRFGEFIIENMTTDREKLCFKIAEAESIEQVERARYFVAKLKEHGYRVALDNFGVGMGSFALLKRLQIDYLKINADTISNMPHSSVDYEIVLASSRIAKTLNMKTVAEGVTTHATRQALYGLGIDYVQGLVSGRPLPITSPAELNVELNA